METVLASRQKEQLNNVNNSIATYYYSLYCLKANRKTPKDGQKSKEMKTFSQFLDNEAFVNKDFSLTLIVSNVPSDNELQLRENIARKVEKGTLYASNIGNISNFNLGFKHYDENLDSICYYCLYRQSKEPNFEYLICFIVQNSKFNLDLIDLDFFVEKYLIEHLETENFSQSEKFVDLLKQWFYICINYISRLVEAFDRNLSIIIEQAFSCGQLDLDPSVDETTRTDIKLLFNSLNSTYLINDESSVGKIPKQAVEQTKSELRVFFDHAHNQIKFSKYEKCELSDELADVLIEIKTDPFHMKQVMENYKLKVAQELNTFNRYLRQSELNYYDIYKSYVYLKNSSMGSVLINIYANSCPNKNWYESLKIVVSFYNENNNSSISH